MTGRRVAVGCVLLGACRIPFAVGQPVERVPMPIVRMSAGPEAFSAYTGIGDSIRTVIRDSVMWRQLWDRINRPFYPRPALPVIDFAREMVVVAGLGTRPSGGYNVIIESAARDSAGIEVALRRATPAPGCPVPAVMTQPLDLVRIPASGEPVRFREHTVVVPCGTR